MILNAIVIEGDVLPSTFYDQMTGAAKPGYAVEMTVLDSDTKEKYVLQVTDGFQGLETLKELRRLGGSEEQYDQVAAQLKQELPPELTKLTFEVLKFKGKSAAFIKLVCRLLTA